MEGSRKRRNWRNKRGSFQKHTSQAWQHISLIPAFGSQSQANLWVQLKAVLHRIECQLSLYSLFMKNKTEEIKPRSTVGSNYLREGAFLCCGYSNDLQLSNSSWGYPSSDAEGLRGRRLISSYPSTHIHWLTAPYPISSAHLLASSSERMVGPTWLGTVTRNVSMGVGVRGGTPRPCLHGIQMLWCWDRLDG